MKSAAPAVPGLVVKPHTGWADVDHPGRWIVTVSQLTF